MIFELVAAVIDHNAAAADIVMSPAPNKDVPFMVLMLVPLTKIGWYVAAAAVVVKYGDNAALVIYPLSFVNCDILSPEIDVK